MGIKKFFGQNLRQLRRDLKLSQEKFAELLDIQARSLSDIENGKYLPHPDNIDKICLKLNIAPETLFKPTMEKPADAKSEVLKLINIKLNTLTEEKLQIALNILRSL